MPSLKHGGSSAKNPRSRKQSCSAELQDGGYPQKTISELFATSKRGLKEDLPSISPSKKFKRGHATADQDAPAASPKALEAKDMRAFGNPTGRSSEVIDLTSSPSGSPAKRKPNGPFQRSRVTAQSGPKKLVVKNLKSTPRADPDEYYNIVWRQLDAALSAIFSNNNLPCSMEELYNGVESVCRQDRAPALYKRLCEKCTNDIRTRVKEPLFKASYSGTGVEVLDAVVESWSTWAKQLEIIRSIFYYLDRSYLLHSALLPSIEGMGTEEFRIHIFSTAELKPKILQGACDLVSADRRRDEGAQNQTLLRTAVKMFQSLSVYANSFEPKLMSGSEQYFLFWAQEAVSTSDLATYVKKCHDLIDEELKRCDLYGLDPTTKKDLETYLEDILIDQRQSRFFIVDDVGGLLFSDRLDALQQLYSLLQRRRLGEKLRPAFEAYIVKQGSGIVFDEDREQEMVARLLEFRRKLDMVWERCFSKQEDFGHSLREAFETFINQSKRSNMTWGTDNPKPGEMIAKYVDMVLKGGTKTVRASGVTQEGSSKVTLNEDQEGPSDDEDVEMTKQLDQVLSLFRFVHGKAVFEAFYKRDLARRLLLGRSANSDAEKSMLIRLKSECGAGFTHNLEQMFKDIEMAREEISSYKSLLEKRQTRPAFDLSVNVLSASAWPSYPDFVVNVPENILKATASFEQHYKVEHTGRKLEWKHPLAHCQLHSSFPKGDKEIVVSCFQAVILMSFNNSNESMSYNELQAASGLDDAELKRTLQSLACAKYRVLSKSPKGKDVNVNDSFAVNLGFSHPKYRIKINQIQAKETKAENQQTHERVAADRNYETQAAIVRIMKSRKKITHAELVSEVISATKSRGVLDLADIKKNIEKLIDKDYMERDEDGRNTYSYLA